MVKDVTQVSSGFKIGDYEILMQFCGRFRGEEPEPRPGLRQGTFQVRKIFFMVIFKRRWNLKSQDELIEHFKAKV